MSVGETARSEVCAAWLGALCKERSQGRRRMKTIACYTKSEGRSKN